MGDDLYCVKVLYDRGPESTARWSQEVVTSRPLTWNEAQLLAAQWRTSPMVVDVRVEVV